MSEATTAERPRRRVRPWIAALLSLPAPGLGHFYAGRDRRALAWILAFAAFFAAVNLSLLVFEDSAWLAIPSGLLLLAILHAVDAFSTTSARRFVDRNSPLRLLGYLAVYMVGIGIQFVAGQALPVRSFHIPSGSMVPTLEVGDRVLVRMFSPLCPAPAFQRGDIVLVNGRGAMEGSFQIRRVVGLGGDEVRIDVDGLIVNGERATGAIERTLETINYRGDRVSYDIAEERIGSVGQWTVHADTPSDWGQPYDGIVPDGHIFTLGDNRANSNDDRRNGPTPIDAVAGRALRIPFSLAPDRNVWWRDLRVNDEPSCATS
jgi:signal peptidase I